MHLRPYQQEAIEAVRADWAAGIRETLLVLPTGGGKTVVFLRLIVDFLKANPTARCLLVAHRRELVSQPLERLRQIDPDWLMGDVLDKPRVGVIRAERGDVDRQLTVATVQSLSQRRRINLPAEGEEDTAEPEYAYPRLDALLAHGPIDLLVVDEAHHSVSNGHRAVIERLRQANPALLHLGVTATPKRADEKGLATIYDACVCDACEEERSKGKTHQRCPKKVSIARLVSDHYLVQPRWLAIETGISLKGVGRSADGDYSASDLGKRYDTLMGRALIVKAYYELAHDRRKAIAFVPTVASAYALADAFSNPEPMRPLLGSQADEIINWYRGSGFRAVCIEGKTQNEERDRAIADFRKGSIQMLVNVDVLTEGFDSPGANCVLMARPTKSEGRYLQAIGRGLRPAGLDPSRPGVAIEGEDCLILEFIPEETRDLTMAGDVLGAPTGAIRTAISEKRKTSKGKSDDELEIVVQAGFTFDGHDFNTQGTPLEIVARQLDYLNASRWQWDRRDGWMTLGLGPGSDGIDRTLAIAPTTDGHTLYGLRREPVGASEDGKPRYGRWQVAFTRSGALEALCELAERQADRHAVASLAQKNRTWHKRPASEGQLSYLRRLVPKGERVGFMTSGEAAAAITFWQVRQTIDRLCETSHRS